MEIIDQVFVRNLDVLVVYESQCQNNQQCFAWEIYVWPETKPALYGTQALMQVGDNAALKSTVYDTQYTYNTLHYWLNVDAIQNSRIKKCLVRIKANNK